MRQYIFKSGFVILATLFAIGVASAQGPKESTKHAQTAKTGTHHHSSSSKAKAPTRGYENGYEWVDLGLSVKWATCNVGANSPEEYGDYFAWGETDMKSEFTWENYKFRTSGDSRKNVKFSKYNTQSSYGPVDDITVLQRGDDVACAKWGGNWRMPTKAEFEELLEKCNKERTTYNGVKGYQFTSKTNGKSIFLPAAGNRSGTVLGAGTIGDYWSSSLSTGDPNCAWLLYFDSGGVDSYGYYRGYGRSVRPVSE